MVTYYAVTKDKSFPFTSIIKRLVFVRNLRKAGLKVSTGKWTTKNPESPAQFVKKLRAKL